MGLYNMIFGVNPLSGILLGALDLTAADVGRFRDAWVTEEGEVAIYTRNGGGNRECWNDADEKRSEKCDCTGCTMEYKIPRHPLYLRDADDEFDSTYATIFYKMPEALKPFAAALAEKKDPSRDWVTMLEALQQGKRPEVVEKFRPLVERLTKALEDKK